jgi:hypothetical protein
MGEGEIYLLEEMGTLKVIGNKAPKGEVGILSLLLVLSRIRWEGCYPSRPET